MKLARNSQSCRSLPGLLLHIDFCDGFPFLYSLTRVVNCGRALEEKRARLGLVECMNHELLQPYPVLHEKQGSQDSPD